MPTFEEFVRARSAALLRTAYLLTGDRHTAEDLLQDTLARALDRWDRIDPSEAGAEAYVRRILLTRSIDAWRGRRTRVGAERRAAEPPPAMSIEVTSERRLVLADALARLTARQRAVLVLRFYDDLTEAQTALTLGCSVSTVKSQTRHALGWLRAVAPELLADLVPTEVL